MTKHTENERKHERQQQKQITGSLATWMPGWLVPWLAGWLAPCLASQLAGTFGPFGKFESHLEEKRIGHGSRIKLKLKSPEGFRHIVKRDLWKLV